MFVNMKTSRESVFILACILALVTVACSPKTYNSPLSEGGPGQMDAPPKPVAAPGECFALADMPRKFETVTESYFEYTGVVLPDSGVVNTVIETKPRTQNWVKKPSQNCKSVDPEDCLIWCLEVQEQETISFNEVIDTSVVKEFKKEEVVVERMLADSYKDWVRVVCENELNSLLIQTLADSLRTNGYFVPYNCRKSTKCLKESLMKYQRAKSIPVGSLNHMTLDSLGVHY